MIHSSEVSRLRWQIVISAMDKNSEIINHTNSSPAKETGADPAELVNDFENKLEIEERSLSDEELKERSVESLRLKLQGNQFFSKQQFTDALECYNKALEISPIKKKEERAILLSNRAAVKQKLGDNEAAIIDCTKSIELNGVYVKPLLRRANLFEGADKLDESLEDFKKVLELDGTNAEAKHSIPRLNASIHERNEKMKADMIDKMKVVGNTLLTPFGLSTDNFKLQQDPNTGGYSISFQK